MALADYFHRSALAVAQVVGGYDESRLSDLLNSTSVAISVGDVRGPEAEALADLSVRLLSRLYPRLTLVSHDPSVAESLASVARAINPAIELGEEQADLGLLIGSDAPLAAGEPTYLGSDGWTAFVSPDDPQPVGTTDNPLGAGASACLGAASIFRRLIESEETAPPSPVAFSTWTCEPKEFDGPTVSGHLDGTALAGAGAIGNAAAWALARCPLTGGIVLVDHETLELSNLQRYVLGARDDAGAPKVELLMGHFSRDLRVSPARATWQEFVAENGYDWRWVLVALDSARDRRAVQASLPERIVNAWTQPGDLGVSVHPQLNAGACLACLYHPKGTVPNEDQLVASALQLDHARFGLQIRQSLDANAPPSSDVLDAVASQLGLDAAQVAAFKNRPLRDLYVEGVCGGALVPLDRVGVPDQELHVPLAHQSALAGVLLAARFIRMAAGDGPTQTMVTRLNVMRRIAERPTQPMAKREDGACLCQDPVFATRYEQKWGVAGAN